MPQENGSRGGCKWVKASGQVDVHINAVGTPLSFNASHYTQEMLTEATHNFKLSKCGSTVLCIDYAQSGVGSASCGPELAEEYQLNGDFIFEFIFMCETDKGEKVS